MGYHRIRTIVIMFRKEDTVTTTQDTVTNGLKMLGLNTRIKI